MLEIDGLIEIIITCAITRSHQYASGAKLVLQLTGETRLHDSIGALDERTG